MCVCVCIDIILYHVMLTFTKVRRVSLRPHYLVNILEAHGKSSWRMPMHVISSTKTSTLPCKHTRAQPFLSRISAWERAARFERSWIAFFCMASAASRRSRNNLSNWLWDNFYRIIQPRIKHAGKREKRDALLCVSAVSSVRRRFHGAYQRGG